MKPAGPFSAMAVLIVKSDKLTTRSKALAVKANIAEASGNSVPLIILQNIPLGQDKGLADSPQSAVACLPGNFSLLFIFFTKSDPETATASA